MRVSVISKTGKQLVDRYSDEAFFARKAEENPERIYYLTPCWENLIESIKYKKGWTFYYILNRDAEMVSIVVRTWDRDNYLKQIRTESKFVLGPWLGEEAAWHAIRFFIAELEFHELDENLLFDGVRVFDPHKDDVERSMG